MYAVFVPEFIVIFIINACTLIVFARSRHLRKRTTYLIINLTVADLLVGAVSGPLHIYHSLKIKPGSGFSWQKFNVMVFEDTFAISSIANLCLISLERLHATLYPFRHCLIGKLTYIKTILCIWSLALTKASVIATLYLHEPAAYRYLWGSFIFLSLLIITTSYAIIIAKVKSNSPRNHFGLVAPERKLSVTLFIVSVVSVLTILPWVFNAVIQVHAFNRLSKSTQTFITYLVDVLFYASSFVNPLVYAIRMQEFRKAARLLSCKKTTESRNFQDIELHAI